MRFAKFSLAALAAAALGAASVSAQTVLIDPTTNNGSFEYAGGVLNTSKIQNWDASPDIDNWTIWAGVSTADSDSGVENTGNASDGTMVAFMQSGNAVHNMTSWIAAEGDQFNFSWDHVLRGDRDHTVGLVYDDGGTITSIAASEVASTGVLQTIASSYVIPAGSPAIGKAIGLGVVSPGGYPEIDNFVLTVGVPEPCSALLGFAAVGLVAARRGRR